MPHIACTNLINNTAKVVVGKSKSIELLTIALLSEGHVLLEDVPGLGKTLMAKSIARSMGGIFRRIQFTPDLLPADVTGFSIFDQKSGNFIFHPGPVMCNVLLADEINRTIPRTQSSLLESMGEFQVTVDGKTMDLPKPFLVIATQNPIEMDGTFPLPEAQLDRFLMKIDLGYPTIDEEMQILERYQQNDPMNDLHPVLTPTEITAMQKQRARIKISPAVREYIATIAAETRKHSKVRYGVSPRGALGLMRAAQSLAMLRDRTFVLPDDIKTLAHPVLSHRIIIFHEERTRGITSGKILEEILNSVPVPVYA